MKKFLSFIKSIGVIFHLSELRKFADSLIEVPELHNFVKGRVSDLESFVQLITDNDPDNKKQLRKLYEENREKFVDDALLLAAARIEEKLGASDPEKAAYLASTLRQIAQIDLFPQDEQKSAVGNTALQAISTGFTTGENPAAKKGKKTATPQPIEPQQVEPHKLPKTGDEPKEVVPEEEAAI